MNTDTKIFGDDNLRRGKPETTARMGETGYSISSVSIDNAGTHRYTLKFFVVDDTGNIVYDGREEVQIR